jgi:hypothetical protein
MSVAARRASCVAVLAIAAVPTDFSVAAQQLTNQAEPKPSVQGADANRMPDAIAIMRMRERQVTKAKFEAANAERKRQLDQDSLALLRLAAEVKAEIDCTNGNSLSLNATRKVEEIERLAHNVQVKMKLTVGAAN